MAVKIRLARIGKTHSPVYRIVAIDSHSKRDGRALEILGTYNPLREEIVQFKHDRIKYWQDRGATISDAARKIERRYVRAAAATSAVESV